MSEASHSPTSPRSNWLFACALLLLTFGLQTSPPPSSPSITEQEPSQDHVISQQVKLVVLTVIVRARKGQFVSGLQVSNFHVYDEGRPEKIAVFQNEDMPVTVGLMVDRSGSMLTAQNAVMEGALAFVRASNPQNREFVVSFGDTVSFGLPKNVPFTNRVEDLQAALSIPSAIGRTALYDALVVALNHIQTDSFNKKALLVISDGGDNASTHTFAQVLRIAQSTSVVIYAIGLLDPHNADQNPAVLEKLARETGGQVYIPNTSEELITDCREIAADIRHQYTLGYDPPEDARPGYRRVRVKVEEPGRGRLLVRTRNGYFLPPSSPGDAPSGRQ